MNKPTTNNGRASGYSAFFALDSADVPPESSPWTPSEANASVAPPAESSASATPAPPAWQPTASVPPVGGPSGVSVTPPTATAGHSGVASAEPAPEPPTAGPSPETGTDPGEADTDDEADGEVAQSAVAASTYAGADYATPAHTTTDPAAEAATPEASADAWSWPPLADTVGSVAPAQVSGHVSDVASTVVQPSLVPDRIEASGSDLIPMTFASSTMLGDLVASERAELRSTTGIRGALNKVGFRLGLSPAEQRAENRRARIRRQLAGTYQIAVISVKGGVGRTTTTATLGSTFASLRADRVVAIDANPDFGDLATRTVRHPYGLTLRDLVHAPNLDTFPAVQAYTTTNAANLDVVASAWTSDANVALSGEEYAAGINILRRYYSLLLADCGTGVLDSATVGVLTTSHAVLVVTPATVGGVSGAVATLNWLHSHGLQHLTAKSMVAIVGLQPGKPQVELDAIEKVFASAQRPTYLLPYDPHLAEGGPIDLRLLQEETLLAYEELAAALADDFPGFREAAR